MTNKLLSNSKVLSVSTGNGYWDYILMRKHNNLNLFATDIVKCPVKKEGIKNLRTLGNWKFYKVEKDKNLPFEKSFFDFSYSVDVIEHTNSPYNFLKEQERLLKKGGTILVATPNVLRPMNIIKLFLGKLKFPQVIGYNQEIGEYIHIQEFTVWQLQTMLEEVGFKNIQYIPCHFGISKFLRFSIYPKSSIGKAFSHYLFFKATKS